MEKYCEAQIERIDDRLGTQDRRLDNHSKEIDLIKLDIMAQKKDTTHLQEAIKSLKISIDLLIEEIGKLKMKPLQKYEQVIMIIVSLVIGFFFSKIVG